MGSWPILCTCPNEARYGESSPPRPGWFATRDIREQDVGANRAGSGARGDELGRGWCGYVMVMPEIQ